MTSTPRIGPYRFGRIVVDDTIYHKDVIILPQGVLPGWRREEGHMLHIEDLQAVLNGAPEVLIIGKGMFGRLVVPKSTSRSLDEAGIELFVLRTDQACKKYNELRERRAASAALHLSC